MKKVCILFLCLLCVPVFGQEKAFKAAMKKGKNAAGYYHADLSKTAYSQEHLTQFAKTNGFLLKNLNEQEVVQFGTCYTAVVSVDFIPISELSSGQTASNGYSSMDPKLRDLVQVLNASFNSQGGGDIVKYGQEIGLGKDRYEKEDLKRAGSICGYELYKVVTGGGGLFGPVPENFYFLSRESLENRLFKMLNGGKTVPFSSGGNALMYSSSEKRFQGIDILKWTGTTVNGKLGGTGIGYSLDEGDMTLRVVTGRFADGLPVGECKFYVFSVHDLVEGAPTPVIVNVYPSLNGLARCDIKQGNVSYSAFVNDRYENVIADCNRFSAELLYNSNASSSAKLDTRIVNDFGNGTAVLACNVDGIEIEYFLDKSGHATGLTARGQSSIDAFLDSVASHYDNYMGKVLNPTDVIHPVTSLKNRFNYDLNQFPLNGYTLVSSSAFLKPAVASYRSRKSTKPDLAYNTYMLLRATSELEEKEKQRMEDYVINSAKNTGLTKWVSLFKTTNTTVQDITSVSRYETVLLRVRPNLDAIGSSPLKPSNFSSTRAAVEKEFDRTGEWWKGVYKRANNILAERHSNAAIAREKYRQSMCENCLVDGSKSTFPKGYIEKYEGIFTSRPAQSETDGELVLKNGETCTWKFIYHDSGTEIEVGGTYPGTYESVEEMIETILNRCNDRWGKK